MQVASPSESMVLDYIVANIQVCLYGTWDTSMTVMGWSREPMDVGFHPRKSDAERLSARRW